VTPFLAVVGRDLQLAFRQGGEIGLVIGFFVLAVVLYPFGVGPEPETLRRIGAGILWVAALLSAVLSLDRLFAADYADGGLDLLAVSALPLEIVVLAKCAAHWLATGLPLTLISPFLAVLVDLDSSAIPVLMLTLLIGTPALSLLGAIAAALTLGARRPGVLSSLLVLPLYLPPLIFATAAVEASLTGAAVRPHLLLLGAVSLAALPLAPLAAAAGLRQALD
jgi:heme exporter protein B